jgi:hypothetical protein
MKDWLHSGSMKRALAGVVGLGIAAYIGFAQFAPSEQPSTMHAQSDRVLADAFEDRRSNFQIAGQGIVTRILPDDREGSRHQRFIVRLDSGQTVLISHNIDLAPRISSLNEGDTVAFSGEYEWSSKGGVIHWTHHDPEGRRAGGWLKHNGRMYQ